MVAPGPAPETCQERKRGSLPCRLPRLVAVLFAGVIGTWLQAPASAEPLAQLTRESPSAVTSDENSTLIPFGARYSEGHVLPDGLLSLDERDTFIRFHRVPQTRSACRAIAPFDITDASLAQGVRAYVRIDPTATAAAVEREKARNRLEYAHQDSYEDDTDPVRETILRMYECRKETGIGYS